MGAGPSVDVDADAAIELREPVSGSAVVADGDERIIAAIGFRFPVVELQAFHVVDPVSQIIAQPLLDVR